MEGGGKEVGGNQVTDGAEEGGGGHERTQLADPPKSLGNTVRTVANLLSQVPGVQSRKGVMVGIDKVCTLVRVFPQFHPKLADRISKGEYIDMCDLLPEFWTSMRAGMVCL